MEQGKIVVFDSGIGGVYTLKECMKLLPKEQFVYIADNAFLPYGNKSACQIAERMINIFLAITKQFKVKLFVIACNTATAVAIDSLRGAFTTCFIGMQPPIKPAIEQGFKNIVVMVTKLTKNESVFLQSFQKDNRVSVKGYSTLARELEKNVIEIEKSLDIVEKSLSNEEKNQTDCVVLGCSHFQLLKPYLQRLFSKRITIIDSYEFIASRTRFVMNRCGKESNDGKPNLKVCLTKYDKVFAKKFMHLLADN